MGTKSKPGTYDCYANAHPDEPMFILLGRDPFAPMLLEKWAELREAARGPSAKAEEARACAQAMRDWLASDEPKPNEDQERKHCPPNDQCLACDRLGYHIEPGSTERI